MISSLYIENVALITKLSINFESNLVVLTGETGAGKSIIVDALSFVLGERADKTMIKHGENSAFVEVAFSITEKDNAYFKMQELGLEEDTAIVINRTLTASGRNECRVNGRVVATSLLKELTSRLVDIFGQSQHQNLFKVENHIGVLDNYDRDSILFEGIFVEYSKYKDIKNRLLQFGGSNEQREREMDMLSYQIKEIENAKLSQGEENELAAKKTRILNAQRIATALSGAFSALKEDSSSACATLSAALSSLLPVVQMDKDFDELYKRISGAKIELEDVAGTLEEQLNSSDYSEMQIDLIESRLEEYKNLKRKYGKEVSQVLDFLEKAKLRYDMLSSAAENIAKLTAEKEKVLDRLYALSQELSQHRKKCAVRLSGEIKEQLSHLGMSSTEFSASFADVPLRENYEKYASSQGFDKVEFLFSANKGEPLKPLHKIISGGEMSRFMLAVKNITAMVENIPTMVFDEIDIGISGSIAQMLATKLAAVSRVYQCIVITHLPQVACMADQNLLIEKREIEGRAVTLVSSLDREQKIKEVARLTGGANIGEHSIPYAKELLSWADNVKSDLK